jgi:subtilisin family serine protease
MLPRIFVLSCLLIPGAAQAQDHHEIRLGARSFTPEPGLEAPAAPGQTHVLVQFERNPSAAELERWRRAGLATLEPLPGRAYFAVLAGNGELGRALAAAGGKLEPLGGLRALTGISLEDKLSAELRGGGKPVWARTESAGRELLDLDVLVFDDVPMEEAAAAVWRMGGTVLGVADYFHRLRVRVAPDDVKRIAREDWSQALEAVPPPPQVQNNSISALLMRVNEVQAPEIGLSGDGVRVGIFDGGAIDPHPEFRDRLTIAETSVVSAHATHVAGTVAASGASDARLKGMAPKSSLYSYTFNGDVPTKLLLARRDYGIEVSQNSWSAVINDTLNNCDTFGEYGTRERDFDRLIAGQGISVVFSIGNDRDDPYCAIGSRGGFHTAGRPAAAKNTIAVAAIDSLQAMSVFSNYGPTRDGRLKPDLAALGVSVRSTYPSGLTGTLTGTSMSAPAVSGALALLIERYRQGNSGESPAPALLKGLLLNTAKDLGNPGPDYTFGYGVPDLVAAVDAVDKKTFDKGRLSGGAVAEHKIEAPAGLQTLRVMLSYADREGVPNAGAALVNNLDLELLAPDGTSTYLPLTLDPARPEADAKPGANNRDPAEQIVIEKPAPGTWTVKIKGTRVSTTDQEYFAVWSFAPVAPPPCTMTIVPGALRVQQQSGSASIAVTRSTTCPAWTPSVPDGWLKLTSTEQRSGSSVLKVLYEANDGDGVRNSSIVVGNLPVPVNQNARCAQSPIVSGNTITAQLTASDCYFGPGAFARLYTFTAEAGQFVSIEMTSVLLDTFLELRDATGNLIAYDDDGGGGTNSRIPAVRGGLFIPFSATYTIVATTYGPGETGGFTLRFDFVDPPPDTAALPRALSGCPAETGATLSARSSRQGRRGSLYYTDVYVFFGATGRQLSAQVLRPEFDSVLYLIAPSGRLAAFNDDADGGTGSRIDLLLNESGLWRLEVSSFGPAAGGAYTLQVNGCSTP